jgi:hypothetical protein
LDVVHVETCFATYETLTEVAAALEPEPKSYALEAEAGRGISRMHPVIDATARAVGEKNFYERSVALGQADYIAIYTRPDSEFRNSLARHLAADALKCDLQLDAWGVPMPPIPKPE